MMDLLMRILSALGDSFVDIFVVLFGALSTFIANQIIKYFKAKRKEHLAEKKKKEKEMINEITDNVVLDVEAECSMNEDIFSSENKKQMAIDKAKVILEDNDIYITDEEISSQIENGVTKLNAKYSPVKAIHSMEDESQGEEVEDALTSSKTSNRRIHANNPKVISSNNKDEECLVIFYSKKGSV